MTVKIFSPKINQFKEIASFVSNCDGLVSHDPHFYYIMIEYAGETALVAEDDGNIHGFVFGLISQMEPDLFFLWQFGVGENVRNQGVGLKLLEELKNLVRDKGCKRIRATVLKDNAPAKKVFEKAGFQNLGNKADYYGENEVMALFETNL